MKTRRLVILLAVTLMSISASGCGYNTLTTKHENVKGKWATTSLLSSDQPGRVG